MIIMQLRIKLPGLEEIKYLPIELKIPGPIELKIPGGGR